jgi:O-antigen ligase
MFWMWFGVLGYCQAAFNTRLKPGWRIVIGLAVAAAIYNTFFVYRDWSSGWVPMLVAIGVCTFIARPRYSIFLALLLIPLTVIYYQRAVGMVMTGDNTYSLMTRMEAWQITLRIIKVNPIFGLGPSNYYWYTALFPILGYFVQFNSHNNYIDIISQTGLVGLAAFLWFCWENGRLIWRSVSRVPDGFERSFLYGCFGGLVGAMVSAMLGDWVLPFVYNIGLRGFRTSVLTFLFLGGAVAIERMIISAPQNVENS